MAAAHGLPHVCVTRHRTVHRHLAGWPRRRATAGWSRSVVITTDPLYCMRHPLHRPAMPHRAPRTLPKAPSVPVPGNARRRLGLRTREAVMEVAAGLLLRGSVSAMSIADLVRLSGVPASSI